MDEGLKPGFKGGFQRVLQGEIAPKYLDTRKDGPRPARDVSEVVLGGEVARRVGVPIGSPCFCLVIGKM